MLLWIWIMLCHWLTNVICMLDKPHHRCVVMVRDPLRGVQKQLKGTLSGPKHNLGWQTIIWLPMIKSHPTKGKLISSHIIDTLAIVTWKAIGKKEGKKEGRGLDKHDLPRGLFPNNPAGTLDVASVGATQPAWRSTTRKTVPRLCPRRTSRRSGLGEAAVGALRPSRLDRMRASRPG